MTLATQPSTTAWTFSQDDNKITFGDFTIGIINFEKAPDKPWFQGKAVAAALQYKNSRDAVLTHVKAKARTSLKELLNKYGNPVQGSRESRLPKDWDENDLKTIYINEPGFYSLISRSKQPTAEIFCDWVYECVLPTIRKFGSYTLPQQDSPAVVTVTVDPQQFLMPPQLIMSMLNPSDVDFVREREIRLRPLVESSLAFQTTYMAVVRLSGYNGLFVKYGSTDQLHVRCPTHGRYFEEFILFSVLGTCYNFQAEASFGSALMSRKIKYERTLTHGGKTYNELIPYNETTNLSVLEQLMVACIEDTRDQMDITRRKQSLLVKEITGIDLTPESSIVQALYEKVESLYDFVTEKLNDVPASQKEGSATSGRKNKIIAHTTKTSTTTVLSMPSDILVTTTESPKVTVKPVQEIEAQYDITADAVFEEYSRAKKKKKEPATFVPQPRQRKQSVKPDRVLTDDAQASVNAFVEKMCELGVDEMPNKWNRTEQYFEPRQSLYSVYQRFTKKDLVTYNDFVVGLLTRGVVEESRAYPYKRSSDTGPCNVPRKSFVGIRLKYRPRDEIAKDINIFMGEHVDIVDRDEDIPETTISNFFKAFNSKFPGWTAYYVNQCMLQKYYRLGKHHYKGEKAWINLVLKNIDQQVLDDVTPVIDDEPETI